MVQINQLKLGQKLSLLLLAVFLGGVVLCGAVLSFILNQSVENQVKSKAAALIETINAVRYYTSNQIVPELANESKDRFIPQIIPSYAARETFETFRKKDEFNQFFYKDATLNPTNPRDQADPFETAVVEKFRDDSELKEQSGFRTTEGFNSFWIARPILISNPKCLQCHTTPDLSPAPMVAKYGKVGGYGWHLNEVVGAQIVSVPADVVRNEARNFFLSMISIVMGIFALAGLTVNIWLRQQVVRPIKQMAEVAEAASTGSLDVEFNATNEDEIGDLAAAFQRMKVSLAMAMKRIKPPTTPPA